MEIPKNCSYYKMTEKINICDFFHIRSKTFSKWNVFCPRETGGYTFTCLKCYTGYKGSKMKFFRSRFVFYSIFFPATLFCNLFSNKDLQQKWSRFKKRSTNEVQIWRNYTVNYLSIRILMGYLKNRYTYW